MSKPKYSQEFLNKRKLMVFIPVPGAICLTLLFYLGGGGEGITAAASPGAGTSGLNHTLPSAGKTALYADKMEASKAPQDSTHRNGLTASLAFTPVENQPTQPAAAAAGAAAAPAGLNYTVQPGQTAGRYDAATDPNVVAMQSRMQRLQQQTSTQPSAVPAPVTPTVSAARPASAPAATSARDTRMDASLKELDELKSQYQKRLYALNSPAAAPGAAPATTKPSKPQKGMTVIRQAPQSVVSSLQPVAQASPTTNGFHTVGMSSSPADMNAVPAVIHSDQVVEQGSTVKMRLLQDVQLEGRLIPRNSFLYGVCNMSGNRLTINATSVQYQGSLLAVNLKAFDIDGGEGLNIPGSVDRDALKQGAATGVSGVDMLSMSPSLGAQAAGIAIQTGKALTGRKIKTVKIHLKANYQLLLKS